MTWKIEYSKTAQQSLHRMDRHTAERILDYMEQRIATLQDPRTHGKALKGPFGELWRYRLGDYRIVCQIQYGTLCILALNIGHQSKIYKPH